MFILKPAKVSQSESRGNFTLSLTLALDGSGSNYT